jgi:hypothetical protein
MAKRKYSINWENEQPVLFEVDGVQYVNLEDVPDERDRSKLEAMMGASFAEEFDREFHAAVQEGSKSSFDPQKLILGIFSAVSVVMLLIAAVSTYTGIRQLGREESASGRVVDMVVRRVYVNEEDRIIQEYYYPVVDFVSADGVRHMVQLAEGSQPPSHEVGDVVTVLYDPEHPLDARIKSFGSNALIFILPAITGVIGLGFLGAVIAVRKFLIADESG